MAELKATLSVVRGRKSWDFIYIALGFVVAIEAVVIDMIKPLDFPWNVLTFLVVAALTFWLFVFNGWFQDRLLRWRRAYEDEAR